GVGGVTVTIHVNGDHVTNATPDSQGYYSLNLTITSPGIYALTAVASTKYASRTITITEAPAAPPVITTVTIDAPASVEASYPFKIEGYVLDQYNAGIGGVTVYLYDNGSHFATVTTDGTGYYTKNTVITQAGIHELAARADSVEGYIEITITAPAPTVYIVGVAMYEEDSYVVGTLIIDGIRYTGVQHKTAWLEEGNHVFNVEPPEGYTFVEWQVHEYGGPLMHTSTARPLSVNIDRHIWIWAEVAREAVGIPTTTTITVPDEVVGVGEKFNISGILYETETSIP
ncbi:unnamed protein product, partial [marine sediment metagenome]